MNIGIIGYGYWGPNLVRNFDAHPAVSGVVVCDHNPERLVGAKRQFPRVETTTEVGQLLARADLAAVAIATPVSTHYSLALAALRAGKHVLVEKPLAASVAEGESLVAEAARHQRVLMVDHTFCYTSAVRKMREMITTGQLGELHYYDSVRINLGLFQHDINVLWDLAAHDLAILDYLVAARPRAVSATGLSHLAGQPENIAYLTLFFQEPLLAHLHVNWLAPVKVRRTLLCGSRRMIVYDDLEPSEKLKVYDKGVVASAHPEEVYKLLISYRTGDMWAPHLDLREALSELAGHFIRCLQQPATPETGGEAGLRVLRILEAANRSLRARGQPVELP